MSASEQWWERKLNIKTSGMIDHFFEMDCNYYEPTDYRVLEALLSERHDGLPRDRDRV